MKPLFTVICLCVVLAVVGCASTKQEILEPHYKYGIVDSYEVETIDAPDHIAGKQSFVEIKTIKPTSKIKIKQGRSFGIKFYLPDFYAGQEVLVQERIEFPGEGLTNPSTKETSKKIEIESLDYFYDQPYLLAYILDQEWEMKKGVWKFSVYLNQRKYIEHEFTLY